MQLNTYKSSIIYIKKIVMEKELSKKHILLVHQTPIHRNKAKSKTQKRDHKASQLSIFAIKSKKKHTKKTPSNNLL